MVKYSKAEMQKLAKNLRKAVKAGNGLPKSISIKDMDGKARSLKITEYLGLFQQYNIFWFKNGREPNYVANTGSKCSTLPIAMNYQDTSVTCCPTSFSMATMCLFGYKSESTCAKVFNTGKTGTSPSDMVAGAKKLGYTATRIKRNYDAVYKSLSKGKPVVAHIQTRPASCLGYNGDYGHYVLIYWCKNKEYYIADPTKGIKRCKATTLDKATNGRDIGYYSINVL